MVNNHVDKAQAWDAVAEKNDQISALSDALADMWQAAEEVYEDLLAAGRTSVFDEVIDNHRDVIEKAMNASAARRKR